MAQDRQDPPEEQEQRPAPAPRGFASMDAARQRDIARQGGESVPPEKRSFSQNPALAAEAGRKGGRESGGNFARNRERAAEAGRKGGQQSGGNFARNPARAAEAGRKARHH
jgi:general stress protein YciG